MWTWKTVWLSTWLNDAAERSACPDRMIVVVRRRSVGQLSGEAAEFVKVGLGRAQVPGQRTPQ